MNICIVTIRTFSCTISVILYETSKALTNTCSSADTHLTKTETRGKPVPSPPVLYFTADSFCDFSAIVTTCLWSQVRPDMLSLPCQAGLTISHVCSGFPSWKKHPVIIPNELHFNSMFFIFLVLQSFILRRRFRVIKQRGTKLSKGCEVQYGHQIEKSDMTECLRT